MSVGAGTDCAGGERGKYSAAESEAKARAEGKFTFKRTAKAVDDATRKKKKVVGERANPSLLSFDEDE
jgi:hypothetical protein